MRIAAVAFLGLCVGWLGVACSTPGGAAQKPHSERRALEWREVIARPDASLRGLSVLDANVVWVGGSKGTLLRSLDGGALWRDVAPADCAGCDFRDVHAFDADSAVAMVAGQPARVYKTEDGGKTWSIVHSDPQKEAFFDAIDFEGDRGYLLGDPLGGRFTVLRTDDRGASWRAMPGPEPIGDEAAFAASGSCIEVRSGVVRMVTGGQTARLLQSRDGGATWGASELPIRHGSASQGAFAVAWNGKEAVVVGGDYKAPLESTGTVATSTDDGVSWSLAAPDRTLGFRSGVVWLDASRLLAVGERGVSTSVDRGRTWQALGSAGYHAVSKGRDGAVFACGSGGRVARLVAHSFRVMGLFGDHMVLPKHQVVPVRGVGVPGAEVVVRGSWGRSASTTVKPDGRWTAPLVTPSRAGPFEVTLRSGASEVVLRDVLVGDVWLGAGQSNMEMPVGKLGGWRGGVRNWQQEVAAADHAKLRLFTVARAVSGVEQEDVEGEWQVCSPATVGSFSASAYFFGRELLARGKAPIGLVVAAWGGTVCEAWTSERGLGGFPEFAAALQATRPGAGRRTVVEQLEAFWSAVPDTAIGPATTVKMPELWSKSDLRDHDGVAFYQRSVTLPPGMLGEDLWLFLGAIDDMDTVSCNGVRVGGMERQGAWATPRRYLVRQAIAGQRAGELDLRVRVVDTGGEGGVSGAEEDLRLCVAGDPQRQVSLAGPWLRQQGPRLEELPTWPSDPGDDPNRPAVLWNAMIAPLLPFPFAGAIWYQGESNIGRSEQYAKLFPAMIEDWRLAMARDLPFYFVQLAPYEYEESAGAAAELREAQAAALALPHTGMVVLLDVGEAGDIHPRDKQSVGRRLALHALRGHYGERVVSDGPWPAQVMRDGAVVRVKMHGADGGLSANGDLRGFELAGADGVFAVATARLDGDSVVLQSEAVAAPTNVRYGWGNAPVATLRNGVGLPARPFRAGVR